MHSHENITTLKILLILLTRLWLSRLFNGLFSRQSQEGRCLQQGTCDRKTTMSPISASTYRLAGASLSYTKYALTWEHKDIENTLNTLNTPVAVEVMQWIIFKKGYAYRLVDLSWHPPSAKLEHPYLYKVCTCIRENIMTTKILFIGLWLHA